MSHEANAAIVALGAKLELHCTVCEGVDLHIKAGTGRASVYCTSCDTLYTLPYARREALQSLNLARRKAL